MDKEQRFDLGSEEEQQAAAEFNEKTAQEINSNQQSVSRDVESAESVLPEFPEGWKESFSHINFKPDQTYDERTKFVELEQEEDRLNREYISAKSIGDDVTKKAVRQEALAQGYFFNGFYTAPVRFSNTQRELVGLADLDVIAKHGDELSTRYSKSAEEALARLNTINEEIGITDASSDPIGFAALESERDRLMIRVGDMKKAASVEKGHADRARGKA